MRMRRYQPQVVHPWGLGHPTHQVVWNNLVHPWGLGHPTHQVVWNNLYQVVAESPGGGLCLLLRRL